MHPSNLEKARDAARRQPTRLFSFDVFDTFLLRRCGDPVGVFERAFRVGPLAERWPGAVETFVQHRMQAEAKARRARQDRDGSTEVSLADIYAGFPFRLFDLTRTRLPELIDAEIAAEHDLCVVDPQMRLLFEELRASGIRAGFVSDTYLTGVQLAELLRACAPGLAWDFLYASCDHGTGKRGDLFARCLADQRVEPAAVIHIGDNAEADIVGARRHGIRAMHHPQATATFAGILQRETAARGLLCADRGSGRLDGGLNTLRRLIAGRLPDNDPAFTLGATVLGPVMTAFDHFVAERVERLSAPDRRVALAFLARDGHLSFEIWRRRHARPGYYVEVNRRCSLVASANTAAPLIDLFRKIHRLDAAAVADILKLDSPRLHTFFAAHPGGIATGEALADALPNLLGTEQIATVATALRREMLTYLRATIPDFDGLTDLVLVDLGYSGSVQKALRGVFDSAGLPIRLHGLYLLTVDEAFEELAPDDSAEGFISDLVVTPHVNRMLMRNVALLEQLCCAPDGTVRGYRAGTVLREADPRPPRQIALGTAVQAGALHFAAEADSAETTHRLRPFDDVPDAAPRAAALLARLLVMPTEAEIALLGPLAHDVNLGTAATVAMADPRAVDDLSIAAALPAVCAAKAPPMWMGASMAALSPALGFLYALHGAGRLPGDLFADLGCGRLDVGLLTGRGRRVVPAACYRTGFADLRIRIPVRHDWNAQGLCIPLGRIAGQGTIRGVAMQTGATAADAMESMEVVRLPAQAMRGDGITIDGSQYHCSGGETCDLVLALPAFTAPVAIVSVMVTPQGGGLATAVADHAA
jgi:FMN phosphatase YigB (HAD superfamily)